MFIGSDVCPQSYGIDLFSCAAQVHNTYFLYACCSPRTSSVGKKLPFFVDIRRKVHEKWSICCARFFMFVSLSYKNLLQCSFYTNLKNRLKIQKSLCITTKTCTQIQNFLENYNDSEHAVKTKKCSIFHELSEYPKTQSTEKGVFWAHPVIKLYKFNSF
jgi:hypothetical protein